LIASSSPSRATGACFTLNQHRRDVADYFRKRRARRRRVRDTGSAPTVGQDMSRALLYGFPRQHLVRPRADLRRRRARHASGALQGYFGGRVDLVPAARDRDLGAMPELYLLIIFASIFEPSLLLLLVLLSPVRLDRPVGLRARRVPAQPQPRVRQGGARAGPVERADHLAPRAAELDDAGDHLPAVPHERRDPGLTRSTSSASACRRRAVARRAAARGQGNLDAWWIIVPDLRVLVLTMLLLTFIGDALRDAFDTRKS
jgi:microcin C transport system permease protein